MWEETPNIKSQPEKGIFHGSLFVMCHTSNAPKRQADLREMEAVQQYASTERRCPQIRVGHTVGQREVAYVKDSPCLLLLTTVFCWRSAVYASWPVLHPKN
ncbi:Hypothetical predicted protein [Podarcis lilfordi]|uniref:Uncharacterized protein n=1 Tax=Podarcis lilfordi TaxID=74358 RepID=A0AA35JTF7_9SAUR|nr:Hypothetical predicted protein [Podarcis lilfordi]